MSEKIFDEDLSPELKPNKAKEVIVDYQALTHFIQSNFPIGKTDFILKLVESWKNLPKDQDQYKNYARKLSNDDLDLLLGGINSSIKYK